MSDFTFDGFEPANTTPVPDVLFDVLLSELSESELKVLLYIIRRTAGFKKQTDAISLTQFQKGIKKRATGEILDKGCGVKDRATIIKALASLERKGCIESTKAHDPQGDAATSSYRIRFRSASNGVVGKTNHPTAIGSGQNQPPWFAKPTTGSGQNQPGVVGDSNPQETVIQPNSEQETERQEEGTSSEHDHDTDTGAIAPTPALSQDRDATYEEAWNAYKRVEPQNARTNQMLANGYMPTPAHSPIATDTPTETQEGHNNAATGTHRTHGDSHSLASEANFTEVGTDRAHAERVQKQDTTSERVAPERVYTNSYNEDGSVYSAGAPDSAGYENDDEDTVKTPAVRVPAQQLSTLQASSAQGSGKVSAHVEPKVLDVRTLTLKAHTTYVFSWLDEIRRECERDPLAGYVQSKAAQGLVRDLIVATLNTTNELTRDNVRRAWKEMFDTPTSKDGFSWKGNISIAAFCKHYGDYLGRARKPARPQNKPQSELVNRTYWTDADWDNYRHYGVLPGARSERIQA